MVTKSVPFIPTTQRQTSHTPPLCLSSFLTSYTAASGRLCHANTELLLQTRLESSCSEEFLACCRKANIPVDAWHVSSDHVVKHADRSSLYFCGFPTLQHIKHKVMFAQLQGRNLTLTLTSRFLKTPTLNIQMIVINICLFFLLICRFIVCSFTRRRVEWWCSSRAAEGKT